MAGELVYIVAKAREIKKRARSKAITAACNEIVDCCRVLAKERESLLTRAERSE